MFRGMRRHGSYWNDEASAGIAYSWSANAAFFDGGQSAHWQ
jgi:hypothetical protein